MRIEIKSNGPVWMVLVTGFERHEIVVADQETAERIALALVLQREANT